MYIHSKKRRRHLHAIPAAIALALVALVWLSNHYSTPEASSATVVVSCDKWSMV